ncbi:MAG: OmpA family protein [Bacteroidetes bacterium]|nr:MAG: OmpA family protein [Bacteroidota bacterium]
MKKNLYLFLFLFFFLCIIEKTKAQNFLGLINSNYAGVNGVYFNPASIADSRHSFHINFVSLGADVSNNYYRLNKKPDLFGDVGDANQNLSLVKSGGGKVGNLGYDIRLPSFMVRLNQKHSFALGARTRLMVTGNNISSNLFDIGESGLDNVNIQNRPFNGATANINVHAFAELFATYSRVILKKDKHFLKAGLTFKYLGGAAATNFNIKKLDYQINNENTAQGVQPVMNINNIEGRLAYSDRTRFENVESSDLLSKIFSSGNSGIGFDIGAIYEYRPEEGKSRYTYTMDGEQREDARMNKYKYRIGFAITDIGGIRYKGGQTQRYDFNTQNKKITEQQYSQVGTGSDFTNYLNLLSPQASNSFMMTLPTTMNLSFDYNVYKKFYVNGTIIQNLLGSNNTGTRYHSLLAVTPRLELGAIEISTPIAFKNNYTQVALGTMLRMGPMFIGTDNLAGFVNLYKPDGVNFYFGVAFGIFPKRRARDRDKDGISNKMDLCPDQAGVWELKGCPDADGDGIQDKEDECPTEAGSKEMKGCPDKDADGVRDKDDKCPDVPGKPELNGCPDKDNDGITDSEDECPTEAGSKEMNGCPDKDNDGIKDADDECPTEAGSKEMNGCPDKDNDGIKDKDDKCPEQAGSKEMNGCPDKDGDKVADIDDKCPDVAGLPELQGCPPAKNEVVLTKEEIETLKEAFDNLEFETGKSVIKNTSFESLTELSDVLKKRTQYKLEISGHTDNVGIAATNLQLSKDRANAIKNFLIKKGIPANRLIAQGFGQTKPIADNKTDKGRQKNRRVEMKIVK